MDADETAIRVYRALMRGELCAVTGWYNKIGAFGTRFMPMGFQLMAGEWLMGARKHPLREEEDEPRSDGSTCSDDRAPRSSGDDKNGERQHAHGKDDRKKRDGGSACFHSSRRMTIDPDDWGWFGW